MAELAIALVWKIDTYQRQRKTRRRFAGVALSRHTDLAELKKLHSLHVAGFIMQRISEILEIFFYHYALGYLQ